MSGVGKKLAGEVCTLCEEMGDALKKGHHSAHYNLNDDTSHMAHGVDAAEEEVVAAVPADLALPTPHKFGEDGMRGWSPNEHVFHGERNVHSGKLDGHHDRYGGVDHGHERFDEATRLPRPADIYAGTWNLLDADGKLITKSGGGELKKFSTFWPDHWSPKEIEHAITEAYWDSIQKGTNSPLGFRGYTSGGHPVRAWYEDHGIFTAFPDYPKHWKMGDPTP